MLYAGTAAHPQGSILGVELLTSEHKKAYLAIHGQLTKTSDMSDEKFMGILSKRIDNNSFTFIFFAQEAPEAAPVGIGSFTVEKKFSRGGVSKVHIEDIVVDSKSRRHGYGSKIIAFLKEEALKRFPDVYELALSCSEDKLPFYAQLGFENEGGAMQVYVDTQLERKDGSGPNADALGVESWTGANSMTISN